MANPIAFQPKAADAKINLQRRLDAAPAEHAEAILVAWDLLQAAHDQGLLDMAHGLVTAKDAISGKLAEAAKGADVVAAMRNGVAMLQIVSAIDPDTLECLVKAVTTASREHEAEVKAPSLWELAKRATSEDSRRGLSFMTLLLSSVGNALKK